MKAEATWTTTKFNLYKIDKRFNGNKAFLSSHKLKVDGEHKGPFGYSSNASEAIFFYEGSPGNVLLDEFLKQFEEGKFIQTNHKPIRMAFGRM